MEPVTRRGFFGAAAAAVSTARAYSQVVGANERLRIGVIGCGGMATGHMRSLVKVKEADNIEITADYPRNVTWVGFQLEISPDGRIWKTIYDATRRSGDGKLFAFPPRKLAALRLSHFRRSDGQAVTVRGVRVGYAAARFPAGSNAKAAVSSGPDEIRGRASRRRGSRARAAPA